MTEWLGLEFSNFRLFLYSIKRSVSLPVDRNLCSVEETHDDGREDSVDADGAKHLAVEATGGSHYREDHDLQLPPYSMPRAPSPSALSPCARRAEKGRCLGQTKRKPAPLTMPYTATSCAGHFVGSRLHGMAGEMGTESRLGVPQHGT